MTASRPAPRALALPALALLMVAALVAVPDAARAQTPAATIENADDDVVLESYDDGALLAPYVSSGTGAVPADGAGTRMMWYPGKSAFRAGEVDGNQWNDSNVGDRSVAFGYKTTASGQESTAMGRNTTASGGRSTAMGLRTTASGGQSTAMGNNTTASGNNSTAMGFRTTAATDRSLSIGEYNSANTSDDNSLFVAGNGSSTNRSDAMVLKKSGDLAVGPSDPSVRFEVTKDKSNQGVADNPTGNIALIKNTNSGNNPDVLGLQAGPTDPSSGTTYLSFYQRDGTTVGAIEGNGSGGITFTGTGADFAEELPVAEKAEAPEPAEIVGVRGGTVSLRAEGAGRVMIASTAPIMTGNAAPSSGPDAEEGRRVEVAFVGQVPAKVRGSVDRGDLIVASGQDDGTAQAVSPGEYRRADHGPIAGQAWTDKATGGVGEVTVAVGLGGGGAVAERFDEERKRNQDQQSTIDEQNERIDRLEKRLAALEAEVSAAPATAGLMGSSAGSWGLALLLGLGGLAGGILWRRHS